MMISGAVGGHAGMDKVKVAPHHHSMRKAPATFAFFKTCPINRSFINAPGTRVPNGRGVIV